MLVAIVTLHIIILTTRIIKGRTSQIKLGISLTFNEIFVEMVTKKKKIEKRLLLVRVVSDAVKFHCSVLSFFVFPFNGISCAFFVF